MHGKHEELKFCRVCMHLLILVSDVTMLAKQLHQLCFRGEQLEAFILKFTLGNTKWSESSLKTHDGLLTLVKKSPLGKVLKTICEHIFVVLIRKPSNFVLNITEDKGIGNLEIRLYYLYPVMNEVLL